MGKATHTTEGNYNTIAKPLIIILSMMEESLWLSCLQTQMAMDWMKLYVHHTIHRGI